MLQRAKDARVEVMMLTVDTITGGNAICAPAFPYRSG
jgi:hypothetical protein